MKFIQLRKTPSKTLHSNYVGERLWLMIQSMAQDTHSSEWGQLTTSKGQSSLFVHCSKHQTDVGRQQVVHLVALSYSFTTYNLLEPATKLVINY